MSDKARPEVFRCGNLLSRSPRMLGVFDRINATTEGDTPILIDDESGAGKQQVGLAIHQAASERRAGPFVVVNCVALPEALVESELFGHVKGVFARPEPVIRPGAFERARGGTVFLRYAESLPLHVQDSLLRALDDRRIVRVGDVEETEMDVRVIISTLSLGQLADEQTFRPALLHRLGVLSLPPLRERPEDIPLLAGHFARRFSNPTRPPVELTSAAEEALLRSRWYGNVRELEYVIERAYVLAKGGLIQPEHLPQP